jgi:hypothetical protein
MGQKPTCELIAAVAATAAAQFDIAGVYKRTHGNSLFTA